MKRKLAVAAALVAGAGAASGGAAIAAGGDDDDGQKSDSETVWHGEMIPAQPYRTLPRQTPLELLGGWPRRSET